MPTLPRTKCPVCEAIVHLGMGHPHQLHEHSDRRFDGLGKCPASGKTIAEAEGLIAGRRGEAR